MNGDIVACNKIKQVYRKLVDDLYREDWQYEYNEDKANKVIEFIEKFCYVGEGNKVVPLKLMLWQKAFLQALFGFIDKETGYRKYKEVFYLLGRKNGKTALSSAINTYMSLEEENGECYYIANSFNQASRGWNETYNLIQRNPKLKKHYKKRKADLYYMPKKTIIKPLPYSKKVLDGLSTSYAIYDEVHESKERECYDLVIQSTYARKEPLIMVITTNGFVRDGLFDSLYKYASGQIELYEHPELVGKDNRAINESYLPLMYELDTIEEWDKEECWVKANPGIGVIKSIDDLRTLIQRSKGDDPTLKPTIMTKDFNKIANSATKYLTWETLNNEATYNIKEMGFRYAIGGFDFGEVDDLCSAKVIMQRQNDETIYVHSMYFLPECRIEQLEKKNKIPISKWVEQGLLIPTQGDRVSVVDVYKWFVSVQEELDIWISWIGYDKWRVTESDKAIFEGYFGKDSMQVVRQGAITFTQPMRNLKQDLNSKIINYNNNPIDKMCMLNLEVKIDTNLNITPIKGADTRKKIDGFMSLLDAYVVLQNKKLEYETMI